MKAIVASILVGGLAIGLATAVDAETTRKHKPVVKRYVQPDYDARYAARSQSGYVEQLSEAQPFGSLKWWELMEREGRTGRRGSR